jgi:hypothetical protein
MCGSATVTVKGVEGDDRIRIYVTSALRQRTCCQVLERRALDLRLEGRGGRNKRQQKFCKKA